MVTSHTHPKKVEAGGLAMKFCTLFSNPLFPSCFILKLNQTEGNKHGKK